MIKVLISGCSGKMGHILADVIRRTPNFEIFAGYDKQNIDCDFDVYTDFRDLKTKPDVIIDFSLPDAIFNILDYAKNHKIPLVIATTGYPLHEEARIKHFSKHIPIFKSANMSYEINLMTKILQEITPKLKNSDIEIVETHHNRKVDAPSGTARLLADSINRSVDNSFVYEFDRFNRLEKRDKNKIGFSSIRGGNIVGEHSVFFFGENETLEIKHTALSRDVFAEGALRAAEFIINQKNGLYSMDDLLDKNTDK